MEYPLTEQRKASLSIHLTLNELELRYMSFNHAVIDPPGETSSHGIFVFLDSSGKGLEWRQVCCFPPGQARERFHCKTVFAK
jgi:hypothetical protein